MPTGFIEKWAGFKELDRLVGEAARRRRTGSDSIFREACRLLALTPEAGEDAASRIPRTGPLLVIANHPTGFAEGLALPALLDSVRPDVMCLSHAWFARWPDLAQRMFLVDPQAKRDPRNGASLRQAILHLRQGGCLVLFPAGEVAHARLMEPTVRERPWRPGLAQLVRLTGAAVLPVRVAGRTGRLFGALSRVHSRLGVLGLGRELLTRRGRAVRLSVGEVLDGAALRELGDPDAILRSCRDAVLRQAPGAGAEGRGHQDARG